MDVNEHEHEHIPETTFEYVRGDHNGDNKSVQATTFIMISMSIGMSVFICLAAISILIIYKRNHARRHAIKTEVTVGDHAGMDLQKQQYDGSFVKGSSIAALQRDQTGSIRSENQSKKHGHTTEGAALPEITNGISNSSHVDRHEKNVMIYGNTRETTCGHEDDIGAV